MKTILFIIALLFAIPSYSKDNPEALRAIDEIAITFASAFSASSVCSGTSNDQAVVGISKSVYKRTKKMFDTFMTDTLIMERTKEIASKRTEDFLTVFIDGLLFSKDLRNKVCTFEKIDDLNIRLDYLASHIFQSP